MASKRKTRKEQGQKPRPTRRSSLKKGDPVMVIAGGSGEKRPNKGKVGRILSFTGKRKDRVVVEGVNLMTKHLKQTSPDKPAGKVEKESPIHVSNVMYYVEKLKKPVKLQHKQLEDGTRVRGYASPETGEFVQI